MPDYSDQIPPRDNKTLAITLAAAAAVILVLVMVYSSTPTTAPQTIQ